MGNNWQKDDNRYLHGLTGRQSRKAVIAEYDHERRMYSVMSLIAGFFLLVDIIRSFMVDPSRNLSASAGGLVLLFLLTLMLSFRADVLVKSMSAFDMMTGDDYEEGERDESSPS